MPSHRHTIEFAPMIVVPGGAAVDTAGSIQGWTETWYDNNDLTDGQALDLTTNLATYRQALLAPGWRVKRLKVARFPLTRAVARKSLTPQDGRGYYAERDPANQSAEQPNDTLIVNISSVTGKARNWGLRGLARGVVNAANQFTAPAPFLAAFTAWSTYLKNNFCLRVVTPQTAIPIRGVTLTGGGIGAYNATTPGVLISTPNLVILADKVRISGIIGMGGINGTWGFYSPGGEIVIGGLTFGVIQLRQKRGRTVNGVWQAGGFLVPQVASLSQIAIVSIGDGGSRRTGSFSNRPRGRRSNRAS